MSEWWERVWVMSAPDQRVAAYAAVVALVIQLWSPGWRVSRHAVTVVHEGAHAVVGRLCGRSIAGIRLHSDSSGLTISRGKKTGPGMVATLFAGYAGASMLGLLLALVLGTGHVAAMLWGLLVALALLLLQIRNLYGLWVVAATGVVLVGLTWWAPVAVQQFAAYVATWFLLLAGPRTLEELRQQRSAGRARTSDPDQLARITRLPGGAWLALMLVVDLGALALGALLLVPGLGPSLT